MLDPSLQMELKKANKTATFIYLALLAEPLIYIIIALLLHKTGFKGMGTTESGLRMIRLGFVLVSVSAVANVIVLRRSLLSAERVAPAGADAKRMGALYMRAQTILGAMSACPAITGLIFFFISGDITFLFLLSAVTIILLVLLFPRYEILEKAALARIMQGETLQTAHTELR